MDGGATSIHITALDGIVNVNSLFTLAAFVGVAWNPGDGSSFASDACAAGDKVEADLVTFHVLAFASFLFSSLVALCLKQLVRTRSAAAAGPGLASRPPEVAHINRGVLRAGIVASAVGSVFGCGFLMLALVNVVQVKLGRLGCGGAGDALGAVVPLVTLVPVAMLIYISIVVYSFTR